MNLPLLALASGWMEPLYNAFGWILRQLYFITDNYGATIIIFTVVIRLIMIPLYVKQHTNSLKQMQLSDEVNELRRRYGSDQQGFSAAQMELNKAHGISMSSGCLTSVLGLVLIWPIWRIISAPLQYIMDVPVANIQAMGNKLAEMGIWEVDKVAEMLNRRDIPVVLELQQNGAALSEMIQDGLIRADQLINLDFLGLNLGLTPSVRPNLLFGAETRATYLPLLIIPVIALISGLLMQRVMKLTNPQMRMAKEAKELAKENPGARTPAEQQNDAMASSMKWMLPVMTIMTVFFAPAAMGLYWISVNTMAMVQYTLDVFLYTRPIDQELKKRENERDTLLKGKRAKPAAVTEVASNASGKGKKPKGAKS